MLAKTDPRACTLHGDQLSLVVSELEEARCCLARTASHLTNLGLMTAEIYVRSAVGNLGVGLEALSAAKCRRKRDRKDFDRTAPRPILLPERSDSLLGARADTPDLRSLPARALRSLAVDLVSSDAVRKFAKDRVNAGLLCAALWQCRWFHLGSGSEWSVDRHGAGLLISLLTNGRTFPWWSVSDLNGLVDAQSVRLIASLGWFRLRPSRLRKAC